MRLPPPCYQMYQELAERFPLLRPSQQQGLALWVYGTVLAHSGCQSAVVAAFVGLGVLNSVRQRLREWLYDGADKAAACNTQVEVALCFGPLMRWLMCWWQSKELPLAVDATLHGDKLTALVISVLYRRCAIPVAWHVLPANQRGPWVGPILGLLGLVAVAIPKDMRVVVMTDRGLWSPRLWAEICEMGYHPLMRVRGDMVFQPVGGCRLPAIKLVAGPGHAWVGAGTAFRAAKARRFGTLLVVWDEGQKEPWVVLTDLLPQDAGVSWYGLRLWIELGFRALKGVGWQWERTRRRDTERVARHWLVLSVATLWVMAYGTRAEDALDLGVEPSRLRRPVVVCAGPKRILSAFRNYLKTANRNKRRNHRRPHASWSSPR